jgi:pentatricopeptide repeat protein
MSHVDYNIVIAIFAALSAIVLYSYSRGGQHAQSGTLSKLLNEAHLERRNGNLDQEEYLLAKAMEIMESGAIDDITRYSSCLVNLADCYTKQNKFTEARDVCKRMLKRWGDVLLTRDHIKMIDLDYFAATAEFGSGIIDVIEFYATVIEAKKQMYGPTHPEVSNSMLLYSRLLAKAGDKAQAEQIEAEAKALTDEESSR